MERAAVSSFAPTAVAFTDGLGERRQILDPTGTETLEVLCLRDGLAAVPSFEFALRERVSRLAHFRHAGHGRIRAVERLTDRHATLAVISDSTPGIRLSDLLTQAPERRLTFDINSALCLIRQLVPAVAAFHETARDIQGLAHGAIGPERLIVTPNVRLVIAEYAMGAALEQLRFSQERYWHELRVAVPRTAGLPRFDQRVDVTGIGIVALTLLLGRLLRDDEYPARIGDVVASTWAISARGGFEPLPPGLRGWLGRALQLEARTAFATAAEARAELEKVLGDSDYLASPASLEAFLARYQASTFDRPASADGSARSAAPPAAASTSPAAGPPAQVFEAPAHEPATFAHDEPSPLFESARGKSSLPGPRGSKRLAIAAAVLIALVGGGVLAGRQFLDAAPSPATTGTLLITTNPAGVQALVDGDPRGMTPLTLTLSAGSHVVELRGAGEPRTIPVTIAAGAQASQYIELPRDGPVLGQLQVRTEPAGARVTVDGTPRGSAPIVVADLSPGEHTVVLESGLGSVKQTVMIESGVTASLVVPLATTDGAPVSGWISVSAPVDVQIFENGRLLGTNSSDRIMVSAGRHDVDIVNDALGYRLARTLQVQPGRVALVSLDLPNGTVAMNALPWAEVWIDGEKVGETPIGNLSLAIGPHDVVFRHPELGEQHHTALVTLKSQTRLSVDMRKP